MCQGPAESVIPFKGLFLFNLSLGGCGVICLVTPITYPILPPFWTYVYTFPIFNSVTDKSTLFCYYGLFRSLLVRLHLYLYQDLLHRRHHLQLHWRRKLQHWTWTKVTLSKGAIEKGLYYGMTVCISVH